MGVIDLHCHLLPGIDDGSDTVEDAVALAQAMLAAGIDRVVATPHVDATYGNTPATIEPAWLGLVGELGRRHIPLQVQTGGELDLVTASALEPTELARLTLGTSGTLLVECPFVQVMPQFEALVAGLQSLGHRVLLGHPERSQLFQREPELLQRLVKRGALASLTAVSLTGGFGRTAARYAKWALEEELIHNVATDAHDTRRRRPLLSGPLEESGHGWLVDWLTQEAPRAILRDAELPARPARPAVKRRSIAGAVRRAAHAPHLGG